MPRKIKIIIARHEAEYVAYPLGLRDGVYIVVGRKSNREA
jgi:hypothetical protein